MDTLEFATQLFYVSILKGNRNSKGAVNDNVLEALTV